MQPQLNSLDHLVLTVANIDATVRFYSLCLGMESEVFKPADGTTRTALKFGEQKINLHQSGAEFLPNAKQACAGSADLCFLSDQPLSDWIKHLQNCGVSVEEGPITRTGAKGPILSIYVRDPDGNLIEISNQMDHP